VCSFVVPPKISESETSSDAMVDERGRLSIACKASGKIMFKNESLSFGTFLNLFRISAFFPLETGHPTPTILWRREDNKELNLGYFGGKKHTGNDSLMTRSS
jgi:hypothetical protein